LWHFKIRRREGEKLAPSSSEESERRGEERRKHNEYVFYIRNCPIFMEKVSALFYFT